METILVEESLLEQVLACERVPSLPAVAVQVLEMMKDDNVSVAAIADVVQHDQGLTTKILKTVNSSFYGLSKPCGSLKQAQLLLGLNALKTLALGFSLVSALRDEDEVAFDYESYWRRAIMAGVGARTIASEVRCAGAEEAFLGGLLQDVGMIAMHKTLGQRYLDVVASVGEAHEKLADAELEALGATHCSVGASLAQKWRLPHSLIIPIKHHENPSAAPKDAQHVVRCVGMGNLAAAALTRQDPTPWVARFLTKARDWFTIERDRAEAMLRTIGDGAKHIARLLETPIGPAVEAQRMLETANERLQELSLDREREVERTLAENQRMHEAMAKDALTGLASRRSMAHAIKRAFTTAQSQRTPLALMLIDADSFHRVNESHGWAVGDAVLVSLAERLRKALREHRRCQLARFGGEVFAALLPGVGRENASEIAESVRLAVSTAALEPGSAAGQPVEVTVSVGVAALDPESAHAIEKPEQLLNAADRAARAAKSCGGNCVRVFIPKRKAA